MTDRIRLQRKARGTRPQYFSDPAVDKVLSITMALAAEVSVLRDRIDTIERVAERGLPISCAELDQYVPNANVRAERDAWREHFLEIILGAIHQDCEELGRADKSGSYDSAIDLVESQ